MENERAVGIIKMVERLAADRSTLDAHLQEIAQVILPAYSGSFISKNNVVPGQKRTEFMFDATGADSLNKFAAAMESMLTPRGSTWHRLAPMEKGLKRDRNVRVWFDDFNQLLFDYRYAPRANYASNQHEIYMALGAFGTGCLFIDELGPRQGPRYKAIHLGECYFMENHQGLIDSVYRRYKWTARQIAQKWGKDNLPAQISGALENKPETEFELIHCVKPNENIDYGRLDHRGRPFTSEYVSITGGVLLETDGYYSFPYAVSRYVQAPGELYGRSPAMTALPALKVLNEMKKTILKQGHRIVEPVLLLHDDGVLDVFSMRPGSMNYGAMTADGKRLVDVLPTGNLVVGKELMDDERMVIRDIFLNTLFQILVETPQMTATEVLERSREKGALLSPTMGRQQSEALGPMLEREIDIMVRQGLAPPMPDALREAGGGYKVEYDSPLSRAQKAEQASGFIRTMQVGLEYVNATQDHSALDWLDIDEAMPAIADINATPAAWLRDEAAVQAIREGRQKALEQQQLVDAAPSIASVAKTAPQAAQGAPAA